MSAPARILALGCLLTVGASLSAARAQVPCPEAPPPSTPERFLTAGFVPRRLESAKVRELREALRCGHWIRAREIYFGESYTRELADIVIYIDSSGRVQQGLTKNTSVVSNRVLHGESYVYVLLFAESNLRELGEAEKGARHEPGAAKAPDDTTRAVFTFYGHRGDSLRLTAEPPKAAARPVPSLIVTRTSLAYQPDPLLTRVVSSVLAKVFPGSAPSSTPAIYADSSSKVRLERLETDTPPPPLYVALQRMRVAENAWGRITVRADTGWVLPGDSAREILANFENTDRSRLALGLGILVTLNARTVRNDTLAGQYLRPGVFLLGHWYLKRPRLPIEPWGAGLVLGVRLENLDLFSLNEPFVGVSIDRIGGLLDGCACLGWALGSLGDMGLVAGVSWLESQKSGSRESVRIPRVSVGLSFPL